MKKLISVAVILLFIGLAFAPSINANISKEELVEFTTEVCGLNGGKQTVKLTQQQADEVEVLFNLIREQLNATESREEAEEIFKDAVVELDKYGLLGGLSVKQAQRLVLGLDVFEKNSRLLDYLKNVPLIKNMNIFCLISGKSDYSIILTPLNFVIFFLLVLFYGRVLVSWSLLGEFAPNLWEFITDIFGDFLSGSVLFRLAFYVGLELISLVLPWSFFGLIHFGWIHRDFMGSWPIPSEGWTYSMGLFGHKNWTGEYFGNAIGFTGLNIKYDLISHYYLGHSVYLEINEE